MKIANTINIQHMTILLCAVAQFMPLNCWFNSAGTILEGKLLKRLAAHGGRSVDVLWHAQWNKTKLHLLQ
jgi:hypothetical protein